MKLTYRIGNNNKESLGVFEAMFDNEEKDIDTKIEEVKKLYFKHRFLGNFDPARIQKELSKSRRQP
jgi:hypothetical protein